MKRVPAKNVRPGTVLVADPAAEVEAEGIVVTVGAGAAAGVIAIVTDPRRTNLKGLIWQGRATCLFRLSRRRRRNCSRVQVALRENKKPPADGRLSRRLPLNLRQRFGQEPEVVL